MIRLISLLISIATACDFSRTGVKFAELPLLELSKQSINDGVKLLREKHKLRVVVLDTAPEGAQPNPELKADAPKTPGFAWYRAVEEKAYARGPECAIYIAQYDNRIARLAPEKSGDRPFLDEPTVVLFGCATKADQLHVLAHHLIEVARGKKPVVTGGRKRHPLDLHQEERLRLHAQVADLHGKLNAAVSGGNAEEAGRVKESLEKAVRAYLTSTRLDAEDYQWRATQNQDIREHLLANARRYGLSRMEGGLLFLVVGASPDSSLSQLAGMRDNAAKEFALLPEPWRSKKLLRLKAETDAAIERFEAVWKRPTPPACKSAMDSAKSI